jgi:choline dehydrogenase-like flavoprotein
MTTHYLFFFRKYENMTVPAYATDTKCHSNKGELVTSYIPHRTQLAAAYISAGLETGYKYAGHNGASQTGYSYLQVTTKDRRRFSAHRAFLKPARHRKNLHIATHSVVTKMLTDDKTRTSYGVEYRRLQMFPLRLHARKNPIVRAEPYTLHSCYCCRGSAQRIIYAS